MERDSLTNWEPKLPVIQGAVFRFDAITRRIAKARAGGRCEQCGTVFDLEVHHRLPHSWGGKDSLNNAIVLCHTHHKEWDDRTFQEGVLFGGTPAPKAPHYIIRDKRLFKQATEKFRSNQ